MLETEYYEIKTELEQLKFRIPQSGIKFRYGDFIVESLIDFSGKLIYAIRKYEISILGGFTALYPNPDSDVGFTIREMNMNHKDTMDFINSVKSISSSETRKISIHQGMYIQLLKESKSSNCPICLNNYENSENFECEIHLFACGHHSHKNCFVSYGSDRCPICRK